MGKALSLLVVHESYHIGQLGMLRHTMGVEGAIRMPRPATS